MGGRAPREERGGGGTLRVPATLGEEEDPLPPPTLNLPRLEVAQGGWPCCSGVWGWVLRGRPNLGLAWWGRPPGLLPLELDLKPEPEMGGLGVSEWRVPGE